MKFNRCFNRQGIAINIRAIPLFSFDASKFESHRSDECMGVFNLTSFILFLIDKKEAIFTYHV